MMVLLGMGLIAASWMRPGRILPIDATRAQFAVLRVGLHA